LSVPISEVAADIQIRNVKVKEKWEKKNREPWRSNKGKIQGNNACMCERKNREPWWRSKKGKIQGNNVCMCEQIVHSDDESSSSR